MTITSIHRHAVDDAGRQAADALSTMLSGATSGSNFHLVVVRPDGSRDHVPIPERVTTAIGDLLALLSQTGEASVVDEQAEVSPEDAAVLLGVSRPTVMHRLRQGDLPHRMVGSHHKVRLADVLALRQREDEQRAALQEFGEMTDDMAMQHGR